MVFFARRKRGVPRAFGEAVRKAAPHKIMVERGSVPLKQRMRVLFQPKTRRGRFLLLRAKQFGRVSAPLVLGYAAEEVDKAGFQRAAFFLRTGALGTGLWAAWAGVSDELKHRAAEERRKLEESIVKKRPVVVLYAIQNSFCPAVPPSGLDEKEAAEVRKNAYDFLKTVDQCGNALEKEMIRQAPVSERLRPGPLKPASVQQFLRLMHRTNPSYARLVVDYANALRLPPAYAKTGDPVTRDISEAFQKIVESGAAFKLPLRRIEADKVPLDLPLLFYSKLAHKMLPADREKRALATARMMAAWFGSVMRQFEKAGEKKAKT